MPQTRSPSDLIHWQTRLITQDALRPPIRTSSKSSFVSSGVITLPESNLDLQKGFLVRDPDGHVMELIEK